MSNDTRFKKGQSGNPAGRPKKTRLSSQSADALTLEMAERQVKLRDGDGEKTVSMIGAVKQAQFKSAVEGNALAQRDILRDYERAAAAREAAIGEISQRWRSYKAKAEEAIAYAVRTGRPVPRFLPHPDDVVIDDEVGARIIGPLTEEELAQLEETLRVRDVLIAQDVFESRQWDGKEKSRPGSAILFAQLLNERVPLRYRLSTLGFVTEMRRYERLSKRELLKHLHQSWAVFRRRAVPRGTMLPPIAKAMPVIEAFFEALCRSGP
jgi:hypothetical protein